jgi:hypothetical protein
MRWHDGSLDPSSPSSVFHFCRKGGLRVVVVVIRSCLRLHQSPLILNAVSATWVGRNGPYTNEILREIEDKIPASHWIEIHQVVVSAALV